MIDLKRQAIHDKIRLVALILFSGSLPYGVILISNIAILLLGINWLLESPFKVKGERLRQNPLVFVFIQLFFLYLAGLSYSDNIHQGLFEIEKKLGLLFFPLILSTSNPISKNDLKNVFKSFILFTIIATLICFSYAVYLNYKEGHTLSYVYNAVFNDIHLPGRYYYFNYWYFTYELFAKPIHMHPIYFAMYIVFSSCLSVWLWWDWSGKNTKRNAGILLLLLYLFIIIVLLASRTQLFITLFFGTVFIIYRAHLQKRTLTGILLVLCIYGLGFAFIFLNPVTRERFIESSKPGAHYSLNKYGQGGISLRMYKWKYSLETISENPFFGTGTGDSQDKLQKTYKKNNFEIGYIFRFNAHNQFLQVALELGIMGFLSLAICLFLPLYSAVKNREFLYTIFLALFLISCLTESMLEVNKGIIFYAFFNSIFAFHLSKTVERK